MSEINTAIWLSNIASDYGVSARRMAQVYKAISKFQTDEVKVRNIIEKGILQGKSDVDA